MAYQDNLRLKPLEGNRSWEFVCPYCNAVGVFSFLHRAGWCDGCNTTFVQDTDTDGLSLATNNSATAARWIRVQVRPAEIF